MTSYELRDRLTALYGPRTDRQLSIRFARDIGMHLETVKQLLAGTRKIRITVQLSLEALEGRKIDVDTPKS